MAVLTAGNSTTLTLTDYDSVTISTRGVAVVSAVSGLGMAAGKLAEFSGTRTFGPFAPGSLSITAAAGDCQYEQSDGMRSSGPAQIATDVSGNPIIVDPSTGKSVSVGGSALSADVVVYGATFSGIMAAVSAKKNGASVLLIEPRDDVGGMVVGGIMYTDSAWTTNRLRSTITGLTNEFYRDLAKYYGYDQQTYFQAQNYSAESKVAQRYLDKLLQKWGVPVYQNAKLTAVAKTGTVITSATFDTLGTVTAKQFIDATYTGDMMPLAGVSCTVGREAAVRTGANETAVSAGFQTPSANQPTNPIDPYVTPGDSTSGLIWGVQKLTPIPATGDASDKVMAMGYRLCITNNAGNKIAFPTTPPANYDPARYELLRRHALANGTGWTSINDVFLLQPVLPSNEWAGSKWDINNKGLMSLDYVHPESTEYVTASWDRRAQIEQNIKDYTLGLLYFLQTDSSIPTAVQNSIKTYGFCADEYLATGGFPRHPYCREGRRMLTPGVTTSGVAVLSTDISALNGVTTALAQAYYLFDSHPAQYFVNASGKVGMEGPMGSGVVAAAGARVSRTVVQPAASECTNLLVTWCGSMSHAAYASLRMEPIAGCIGEGAGLIAALAIKRNVAVQSVPSADINRMLNIFGWWEPGALAVSTEGTYADGSCVTAGTWTTNATTLFGTASILSCALTSGTNTVKFTPSTTKIGNGEYDVYVKWSDSNPATVRCSAAQFTVVAAGVTTTMTVDQNNTGDGGDWYRLGTYRFRKGDAANNYVLVTHDNTVNPTNVVGVKFVPAKS